MSSQDPIHRQAYKDAQNALSIAHSIWQGHGKPEQAIMQATFATVLIHIQKLRERGSAPARANGSQPAAPSQGAFPSACLECNGPIYDNRAEGDSKPAWRCKDKKCKKNGKFQTSAWDFQPKKVKKADKPVPVAAGDYEDMPEALDGEDDDLPF